MDDEKKLKIGIVGFGTFGQFLAKRFVARGHKVLATSRTPYDEVAKKLGVDFFQDPDDFCEEHPDVRAAGWGSGVCTWDVRKEGALEGPHLLAWGASCLRWCRSAHSRQAGRQAHSWQEQLQFGSVNSQRQAQDMP